MGRKIFVSYKYADSDVYSLGRNTTVRTYVDKIEEYLDTTDDIYKGESDNEDLSNLDDDEIWEKLKDRIFDSSVTIVMISPKMKESGKYDKSQWIPWEVSYSLKEMTRKDKTSRSNAILTVVLPDSNNSYEYYIKDNRCGICNCRTFKTDSLFKILKNNMFNQKSKTKVNCSDSRDVYSGNHSYIISVIWSDFINSTQSYIDKAVAIKDKIEEYNITKDV